MNATKLNFTILNASVLNTSRLNASGLGGGKASGPLVYDLYQVPAIAKAVEK